MAGGTASDIRAPYPKGEDSLVCIEVGAFTIEASKSADYVVDKQTIMFAFKPKKAELTATNIDVTNGVTLNIEDDSATPQVIVSDEAITAITAGAGKLQALTIDDDTMTINAGAVLVTSYGSGASDAGLDVKVRLWVEPVF